MNTIERIEKLLKPLTSEFSQYHLCFQYTEDGDLNSDHCIIDLPSAFFEPSLKPIRKDGRNWEIFIKKKIY